MLNTRGGVEDTGLERGQGQGHKKDPRPRQKTAFPRTEAKDQGHKRKCSPKKKKKGLHKNFSGDLKKTKTKKTKKVFTKIFQALHKILTIQKILLSSSRGQANFRGLEASRPRPRTSKCVLEDSTSVKYFEKYNYFFLSFANFVFPKTCFVL